MSRRPAGVVPVPPGPGQESVWDYPRPPRVEPSSARIVVELGGLVIADTRRALRVLETSHPPSWYLPTADVRPGSLVPAAGRSRCEYKGLAYYLDVLAVEPDNADAIMMHALAVSDQFGSGRMADLKRAEHLQHGGHIVHQREIHRFDLRPEGKTAVGDHQRVGVADAAEEMIDLRVQDAGFQHGGSV